MRSLIGGMAEPPFLTKGNRGANGLHQLFRDVGGTEPSSGGAGVGHWRPNEK
jgi:hypothetical protein